MKFNRLSWYKIRFDSQASIIFVVLSNLLDSLISWDFLQVSMWTQNRLGIKIDSLQYLFLVECGENSINTVYIIHSIEITYNAECIKKIHYEFLARTEAGIAYTNKRIHVKHL